MIGREPSAIWQDSLEDGRRRLGRSGKVLAATGLLGGFHIALGLMALVATTGALTAVMPDYPAHVLGSLSFGIGLIFVTVGRSELFTENFLIPVAAVLSGHGTLRAVGRLWGVTLTLNLCGITVVVLLAAVPGVLRPGSLEAAGALADTLADRDLAAAFSSAVLAGVVITVFTWLAEAAESDLTRLFVALVVGFVLLAPSLNHSVVGFGEILFGIAAGTASADGIDLARNTAIAVVGNIAGGVVLIALVRSVQAGAE